MDVGKSVNCWATSKKRGTEATQGKLGKSLYIFKNVSLGTEQDSFVIYFLFAVIFFSFGWAEDFGEKCASANKINAQRFPAITDGMAAENRTLLFPIAGSS